MTDKLVIDLAKSSWSTVLEETKESTNISMNTLSFSW